MSDKFKIGQEVVADVRDMVRKRQLDGPLYRRGLVVGDWEEVGYVIVRLDHGPMILIDEGNLSDRKKGTLIALEAIPAGSEVEIDGATGNVRRRR
jgi:hypothetical protein